MKHLIVLTLVVYGSFAAAADAGPLEKCAYAEASSVLQILKSTVGRFTPSKVDSVLWFARKSCVEHQNLARLGNLDESATTLALRTGVERAALEIFGAQAQATIAGGASPENEAAESLASALKKTFADQTIQIDPKVFAKSETNTTTADGLPARVTSLKGDLTLSNGFACRAKTSVAEIQGALRTCAVAFVCQKDAQVFMREIKHECPN